MSSSTRNFSYILNRTCVIPTEWGGHFGLIVRLIVYRNFRLKLMIYRHVWNVIYVFDTCNNTSIRIKCKSWCVDPPLPHKWSDFYERCIMCWIEWKNEIIFFCDFYFSSYGWKLIENWPYLGYKSVHNSKNINRKINFSFVSAYFASFMYIWTLLIIFFFFKY